MTFQSRETQKIPIEFQQNKSDFCPFHIVTTTSIFVFFVLRCSDQCSNFLFRLTKISLSIFPLQAHICEAIFVLFSLILHSIHSFIIKHLVPATRPPKMNEKKTCWYKSILLWKSHPYNYLSILLNICFAVCLFTILSQYIILPFPPTQFSWHNVIFFILQSFVCVNTINNNFIFEPKSNVVNCLNESTFNGSFFVYF